MPAHAEISPRKVESGSDLDEEHDRAKEGEGAWRKEAPGNETCGKRRGGWQEAGRDEGKRWNLELEHQT
jgi:hypothetical protein